MKWLAQAADEASQLDEPNNPIARNSLDIEAQWDSLWYEQRRAPCRSHPYFLIRVGRVQHRS